MQASLGNPGSCCRPRKLAVIMKNLFRRIQYRPASSDGFVTRPDSASNPKRPRPDPGLSGSL